MSRLCWRLRNHFLVSPGHYSSIPPQHRKSGPPRGLPRMDTHPRAGGRTVGWPSPCRAGPRLANPSGPCTCLQQAGRGWPALWEHAWPCSPSPPHPGRSCSLPGLCSPPESPRALSLPHLEEQVFRSLSPPLCSLPPSLQTK